MHLHYRFYILATPMRQPHNGQHGIHARRSWKDTSIANKQPFDAIYLMITINNGIVRVCTHTTGSHLMRREHHNAIGTHAMALNLASKLAELLLTYCTSLRSIDTRAFVVQGNDRLGASSEMRASSLAESVHKVLAIINGDNIIQNWFTVPIDCYSSFAFVACQYDKCRDVGSLEHLLSVFTR